LTEDTLYELLGVTPGASSEEIRAAYRRLSLTYHPDHGGTPAFFRQLLHAYEVLSDPEHRAEYDRSLEQLTSFGAATAPPVPALASALDRAFSSWSKAITAFSRLGGTGRRRDNLVVAAWGATIVAALFVIWLLYQATHGFVLLVFVAVGAVAFWQRRSYNVRRSAWEAAEAQAERERRAAWQSEQERQAWEERVRAAQAEAARDAETRNRARRAEYQRADRLAREQTRVDEERNERGP
jgi:curved DNA-binding protein CbpA